MIVQKTLYNMGNKGKAIGFAMKIKMSAHVWYNLIRSHVQF
jgi:hypothetical protein